MLRTLLDALYRLCGWIACLALFMLAVIVIAQIIGRAMGVLLPSADEFAGYSMAISTFLGLAYTLRANGHIRVTLFTSRLSPRGQHRCELAVLAIALLTLSYYAWYSIDMAYTSYDFGDLSAGLLAIPLWIPQSIIAFGVVLMAVALLDDLINVIRNRPASYERQGHALSTD